MQALASHFGVYTPDPKVGKLLALYLQKEALSVIQGCEEMNASSECAR